MPRIQSRLHVDELQTAKQALAATEDENAALRQQLEEEQSARANAEAHVAVLSDELTHAQADMAAAHEMLSTVQAHYDERERRLQDQVRRREMDIHTLEELVQGARRRETARTRSAPCESCAQLRQELLEMEAQLSRKEEAVREEAAVWRDREREFSATRAPSLSSTRQPSPSPSPLRSAPDAPTALQAAASHATTSIGVRATSSPARAAPHVPSARNVYWQEQLLLTTQQAAACFGVLQRQTHDICSSYCADLVENNENATVEKRALTSSVALEESTERWARHLHTLQDNFNEAVQADAKLISFLVLVAQQQSSEIQQLQRHWSDAQETLREVEGVLDAAQTRVQEREQEVAMLRRECATLTEAQQRQHAQLTTQAVELQTAAAKLQRAEETQVQLSAQHTQRVQELTSRLSQVTQLHTHATAYAAKLEAALLEKQRLLERAVAARSAQQKREVVAAAEAQVAHFVAQLSRSAQQLQHSLTHLTTAASPPATPPLDATRKVLGSPLRSPIAHERTQVKAAASVSSPEPSPPQQGMSTSPSLMRAATRSASSMPYDDSIFLADLTQPFNFD